MLADLSLTSRIYVSTHIARNVCNSPCYNNSYQPSPVHHHASHFHYIELEIEVPSFYGHKNVEEY